LQQNRAAFTALTQSEKQMFSSIGQASFASVHATGATSLPRQPATTRFPPLLKGLSCYQSLGQGFQECSDHHNDPLQDSRNILHLHAASKRFPLHLLFTILSESIAEGDRV
jgi:hypothetical protein